LSQRVAIALGSNLGDRRATIESAARRLAAFVSGLQLSDLIETEPEGENTAGQGLYINAVAAGETTLPAREILDALRAIEAEFGRERPFPGAARTLDLDLILLGDEVIVQRDLEVPHPRFRERFFVLGPLAEIAADLVDPVTGKRVGELLRDLLRDETR
jgi:2-amino-4-hydroxy-6-hydroxymethyldihydropteridine diphosphokinase